MLVVTRCTSSSSSNTSSSFISLVRPSASSSVVMFGFQISLVVSLSPSSFSKAVATSFRSVSAQ